MKRWYIALSALVAAMAVVGLALALSAHFSPAWRTGLGRGLLAASVLGM